MKKTLHKFSTNQVIALLLQKCKKKHLKKEILRKGPACLLKNPLWDSFQFLLVQINHLVSP